MSLFNRVRTRDPAKIHNFIEQLCIELDDQLGDDLESIVLYGSFARSGKLGSENEVANLLIVLKTVSYETLDQIAGPIKNIGQKIPLGTMVLTREDLHSSCDVFPIKFHDMQLYHQVLAGDDVFSDLKISDNHLRLRCEQQLKNLMLRMRADYLRYNQSNRTLYDSLIDANRNLLRDMNACLIVASGIAPEDDEDLPEAFGEVFNLDTDIVNEIRVLSKKQKPLTMEELKLQFGRLMKLVDDSALAIDMVEVSW